MQFQSALSPHKDVLEASIPNDEAGKGRLLEELKRRGKVCVGANQWPDAVALYEKALQCCIEGNEKAILHSNISLCQGKMNQWDLAIQSAENATKDDVSYVKGWWRLGQSCAVLHNYEKAIFAIETAIKIEPDNKALQKELEKMKKSQEKYHANKKAASSSTTEKTTTTTIVKENEKPKQNGTNKKNTSGSIEKMEIDDTEFTKSDHVKGYKIVNGKKTSYFHNELSEEAKQLIGDIAPKKLETTNNNVEQQTTTTTGTSAWNKAGTWEEKDYTKWANDTLKSTLLNVKYILPQSSPAPNATIEIDRVVINTGHASVATVRGKKRYIYEYSITIHWKFEHETNDANGTLTIPDIDGTIAIGDGYDIEKFVINHTDDPNLQPILNTFCYNGGLRTELNTAIDTWVTLFKDTY